MPIFAAQVLLSLPCCVQYKRCVVESILCYNLVFIHPRPFQSSCLGMPTLLRYSILLPVCALCLRRYLLIPSYILHHPPLRCLLMEKRTAHLLWIVWLLRSVINTPHWTCFKIKFTAHYFSSLMIVMKFSSQYWMLTPINYVLTCPLGAWQRVPTPNHHFKSDDSIGETRSWEDVRIKKNCCSMSGTMGMIISNSAINISMYVDTVRTSWACVM